MPIAKNPGGARTDAERRAQNKWDQANRATLGVRLSKADCEAFRAWCSARGHTVNAALAAYVAACLRGDDPAPAAPAPATSAPAIPPDLQAAADAAADAQNESTLAFLTRAIQEQARRDTLTRSMILRRAPAASQKPEQQSPAHPGNPEQRPATLPGAEQPPLEDLAARAERLRAIHEARGHAAPEQPAPKELDESHEPEQPTDETQ